MIKIIPAILSNDIRDVEEKIKRVEHLDLPDILKLERVQIDIIDGKFADNKTIDPISVELIETNLKIDYHLMTDEPINWVEQCIRGMADRVIGQIERMSDQVKFVEKVTSVGAKVGLGIDLDTPLSKIDRSILMDLDVILLMSVPAGHGGQHFDLSVLDKIAALDKLRENDRTPYYICDDGGVSVNYIDDIRAGGVDEAVIGERIFEGNLADNIEKLVRAAYVK